MRGEIVVRTGDHETSVGGAGDWPGRAAGLSSREAEIVALITQGLSNQEVADRAYLSINSVKTYIRSAYRKMDVTSRAQAVLWGVNNGFKPDSLRTVDPALLMRPAVPSPDASSLGQTHRTAQATNQGLSRGRPSPEAVRPAAATTVPRSRAFPCIVSSPSAGARTARRRSCPAATFMASTVSSRARQRLPTELRDRASPQGAPGIDGATISDPGEAVPGRAGHGHGVVELVSTSRRHGHQAAPGNRRCG